MKSFLAMLSMILTLATLGCEGRNSSAPAPEFQQTGRDGLAAEATEEELSKEEDALIGGDKDPDAEINDSLTVNGGEALSARDRGLKKFAERMRGDGLERVNAYLKKNGFQETKDVQSACIPHPDHNGLGWNANGLCKAAKADEPTQPKQDVPPKNTAEQYCDDTACYPYCTNGIDTGGGWGWQPELGGPNGGSCKLPK